MLKCVLIWANETAARQGLDNRRALLSDEAVRNIAYHRFTSKQDIEKAVGTVPDVEGLVSMMLHNIQVGRVAHPIDVILENRILPFILPCILFYSYPPPDFHPIFSPYPFTLLYSFPSLPYLILPYRTLPYSTLPYSYFYSILPYPAACVPQPLRLLLLYPTLPYSYSTLLLPYPTLSYSYPTLPCSVCSPALPPTPWRPWCAPGPVPLTSPRTPTTPPSSDRDSKGDKG